MPKSIEIEFPCLLPQLILGQGRRLYDVQSLSRVDLRQRQREEGKLLLHKLKIDFISESVGNAEIVSSLTHSGDLVFAAVTLKNYFTNLGLDTEKIIDTLRADRLAQRILTPIELEQASQNNMPWNLFVTLIFCIKEAAYKALPPSEQRGLGFQNFLVVLAEQDSFYRVQIETQAFKTVKNTAKHLQNTEMSGRYALLDNQVLAGVWKEFV